MARFERLPFVCYSLLCGVHVTIAQSARWEECIAEDRMGLAAV